MNKMSNYEISFSEKEIEYSKNYIFDKFQRKISQAPEIKDREIVFNVTYAGLSDNSNQLTSKISFKRKEGLHKSPEIFEEINRRNGGAFLPDSCHLVRFISEWKTIRYFFPNDILSEFDANIELFSFPILFEPDNPYAFLEKYFLNRSRVRVQILRRLRSVYGNNYSEWFVEKDGKFKYYLSIKGK